MSPSPWDILGQRHDDVLQCLQAVMAGKDLVGRRWLPTEDANVDAGTKKRDRGKGTTSSALPLVRPFFFCLFGSDAC